MNNPPSLLARLSLCALALLGILLLAAHFSLTVAYLLPLNPLEIAHGKAVKAYIEPYFRQRWALFAPDPPLDNKGLQLRCRMQSAKGVTETPWLDLDRMVLEARRKNLFSPVERLGRVDRAVLAAALGSKEELVELFTQKAQTKLKPVNEGERAASEEEQKYLTVATALAERKRAQLEAMRPFVDRVGSSYCEAFHGSGAVVASQFRIVMHVFPRYSQRAEADEFGEKKAVQLPWGEFVSGIAPLHI